MPTPALIKASVFPARPTPSVRLYATPPSACLCGSQAHPPHRPVPKGDSNARNHSPSHYSNQPGSPRTAPGLTGADLPRGDAPGLSKSFTSMQLAPQTKRDQGKGGSNWMQEHEASLDLRSWCIPVMIGVPFCKQHREGDLSRVLDPTGSSSPVPFPIPW